MLHFVLKDVNPDKVNSFHDFLKEMNDLSVLLTVAAGPYVSSSHLENDENGKSVFSHVEGEYNSTFEGEMDSEKVKAGRFEMKQGNKKIVEVSYTVVENKATSIRFWLDCEGEGLAKAEMEKSFQRDFSHEAHGYMKESLENLRKPALTIDSPELDAMLEEESVKETVEMEEDKPEVADTESLDVEPLEEITKELTELKSRTMELIHDTKALVVALNNLCHDLTRGNTVDFSEFSLKSETLENGATVDMIDDQSGAYKVTLRIGQLDDLSEISFFLEKEDDLIFSLYLTSLGKGRITAPLGQDHIVFKKAEAYLF